MVLAAVERACHKLHVPYQNSQNTCMPSPVGVVQGTITNTQQRHSAGDKIVCMFPEYPILYATNATTHRKRYIDKTASTDRTLRTIKEIIPCAGIDKAEANTKAIRNGSTR